jgi:hypothetical protein
MDRKNPRSNRQHFVEQIRMSLFAAFLFSVLNVAAVWAQSTAQVSGTVKDQTGAVLPGVEIIATQTGTGLNRTTVTDETGSYVLSSLPVGPYRLEATLPGFRVYVQTGIVLQVNSNPIVNVVLEVGQASEQIEVQADAALVETRSTGVSQVIDNTRVLELPLNGRQATELILLSGAAVGGGQQAPARNYPTQAISVGGGMDNGLTYLLDGGTHNDPYNNLNLPLPFPDALQEFKVETSAVPAQYGQHSAGAVNAVTKSGENQLHGTAFEFVRNKVFNARNAFAVTRDGLKRNQFGGTFGGPLVRDKLFFFGGYQGTLQRSEPTDLRQYIPTPAMLAGDWTTITSPACNSGRQITLRAPFTNNRIDPALFSAPALNLVKRLPATADPCGEVRFGRRTNSDEHMIVGKVDYQRSNQHSVFTRYMLAQLSSPSGFDPENLLTTSSDITRRAQSVVLGDTYLLGTGTVSSFRAAVIRTLFERTNNSFFTLSDVGVKNVYFPAEWTKMAIVSVSGGFSFGGGGTPGFTNSTGFQFTEDLSLVRGSHQLAFGGSYLRSMMNFNGGTQASGTMSFGAQQTGFSLGDFMLGKASAWTQGNITTWYLRQHYIGLYLQDTWKLNSRLTANVGLRWEPFLPATDKENRIVHFDRAWFDQGIRSKVYKNAPAGLQFRGDSEVPDSNAFSTSRWMNFAPRFGLAWDPNGDARMTIRAAYGIFFDYPHMFQFDGLKDAPPWGSRVTLTNPVGGFEDPWQGYPGGNPYPVILNSNVTFPTSGTYLNIPLQLKTPYANEWNLSVQRQIGTDWLVTGNYLGHSVIHLLYTYEGNPAVYLPGASCVIAGRTFSPCSSISNTTQRRTLFLKNPEGGQFYGNIVQVDDAGTRSYNAMVLSVQRRRSNGITVQGNYTWSHCIDDGPNPDFNNSGGDLAERRGLDRGNCASDRRHTANLSVVYETPRFSNGTLRTLTSGWRVSGILRVLSGSYLTVTSGLDNALTATASNMSNLNPKLDQRPNLVLLNPFAPDKNVNRWLNPAAFAQPALGTYGNLGSSNILGPGSITLNMGLTRTFQIRENQSLEFRAEAFNLPNHLNPGNPGTILTNANNFGRITTGDDPRIVQLALKYVF